MCSPPSGKILEHTNSVPQKYLVVFFFSLATNSTCFSTLQRSSCCSLNNYEVHTLNLCPVGGPSPFIFSSDPGPSSAYICHPGSHPQCPVGPLDLSYPDVILMTASKFLRVYPGIINNALGSETVIVYWRLLHLSSCELKIGDQTTFFQTLRMAVVLYLQRFGKCILTKAVWESSVRTVLCWKMHIIGHHHQLRFLSQESFLFLPL